MIASQQGEVGAAAVTVALPDHTPLPRLARCRDWFGTRRRRESTQRAAVQAWTSAVGRATAERLGEIFLWIADEIGVEIPARDAVDPIASLRPPHALLAARTLEAKSERVYLSLAGPARGPKAKWCPLAELARRWVRHDAHHECHRGGRNEYQEDGNERCDA